MRKVREILDRACGAHSRQFSAAESCICPNTYATSCFSRALSLFMQSSSALTASAPPCADRPRIAALLKECQSVLQGRCRPPFAEAVQNQRWRRRKVFPSSLDNLAGCAARKEAITGRTDLVPQGKERPIPLEYGRMLVQQPCSKLRGGFAG